MKHQTANVKDYTSEEKGLHQAILAARSFTQCGQYDQAAAIMKAGSDAYLNASFSSAQEAVTGE